MKARTKKLGTRAVARLLSAVMAFSLFPVSAGAAQVNSYHDPAENWMQASGRTNELDVNAVVTHETFNCGVCGKPTSFRAFRTPEYSKDGRTAMNRNVKYSDGTLLGGCRDRHNSGWHSRSERDLYGVSLDKGGLRYLRHG